MSLYSDYFKERENKEVLETENGFAIYKIFNNGECYLQDIYVVPDKRQTGLGTEMADKIVEIAKKQGCHTLIGSVCIDANEASKSMKVLLAYNMNVSQIAGNMIFFRKNIGDN